MEDLGKSIPAAEGMVDAENATTKRHPNEACLNCGTPLLDNYCHHCGQKDIPKRQTLGELWINFISSFWSYEGKFFATARYLITRPGFLAQEYNAGRRERYFHPARMYVFISFIFFLLMVTLPETPEKQDNSQDTGTQLTKEDEDALVALDSLNKLDTLNRLDKIIPGVGNLDSTIRAATSDSVKRKRKRSAWDVSLDKSAYRTAEAYDSAQLTLPESERDGWFTRKMNIRAIEINNRYKGDDNKFLEEFGQAFKDNFSKILFYLLPIFALLLKLLYVRRDFYYSEHLVFSIYYYNFFYFAGSVQMLLGLVPVVGEISFLIGWWILFYLLWAMKRLYGQSWGKTILKFVLFVFSFLFFVGLALVANALVILLMI